jgi:hypothetical protein
MFNKGLCGPKHNTAISQEKLNKCIFISLDTVLLDTVIYAEPTVFWLVHQKNHKNDHFATNCFNIE